MWNVGEVDARARFITRGNMQLKYRYMGDILYALRSSVLTGIW